jgi:O-antigen/teichoic acid export membrane protein
MRHGVRSIAKNTAYLSSTRAISSVSRAIYAILLAAMLGPELYGMFNYVLSWSLLLLPLGVLGLDLVLIREIGRARNDAAGIVGQTLSLRIVSGLLLSCAFVGLGLALESDARIRLLYAVLAIGLFGRNLALWVSSILKGHEVSEYVFRLETGFRIGEVIIGTLALYLGAGVLGVALVHAASWILQAGVGLWLVHRLLVTLAIAWHWNQALALLRNGAPFVVASFLGVWILQGGVVYLRWFDGFSAELGNYMLAMQGFLIIGGIAAELGQAALPVLSRSLDRSDGKEAFFIGAVLRAAILGGGLLAIVAQLTGPGLIHWLFDRSYTLAGELLPWALLIVCNYFLYVNLNSVLIAAGRFGQMVVVALTGALVFSILAPLLFHAHQLSGVIWATGLGLLTSNLLQLRFLKVTSRLRPLRSVLVPLLIIAAGWAAAEMLPGCCVLMQLVLSIGLMGFLTLALGIVPWSAIYRAFKAG